MALIGGQVTISPRSTFGICQTMALIGGQMLVFPSLYIWYVSNDGADIRNYIYPRSNFGIRPRDGGDRQSSGNFSKKYFWYTST